MQCRISRNFVLWGANFSMRTDWRTRWS